MLETLQNIFIIYALNIQLSFTEIKNGESLKFTYLPFLTFFIPLCKIQVSIWYYFLRLQKLPLSFLV